MHKRDITARLLQYVRLPVAVAVVDQRRAAGRFRNLAGEVAPLGDRAEPLVKEHQCRLAALFADPLAGDRAARRACKRHAVELSTQAIDIAPGIATVGRLLIVLAILLPFVLQDLRKNSLY